jgi:hypothetical protein
MLATRMPIAGILVAMLVLVGEVVTMKVYVADHQPSATVTAKVAKPDIPAPHFGRHHGCADRLRISGPDDLAPQP